MNDSPLRLSVLDQAPISAGASGADALHNSIDLARRTDELGYHRYRVAEHHGTPMLACASPEALIGPIAAQTARIRVGSGGVMLPHYSPLSVVESFSMLAGLFPGRIDLAVGRAPGSDLRAGIEAAAREYGADEVMIVTITHEHAARRRSYELIFEAFASRRPHDTAAASERARPMHAFADGTPERSRSPGLRDRN